MRKRSAGVILSSFDFHASTANLDRTIFASPKTRSSAQSFELLRAIWNNRFNASTLLVEGVFPQMWPAVVQKYLPGCRMRVLVTECLWEWNAPTLTGKLKLALMRWLIGYVDRCILYSTADVSRFAAYFRAPREKFAVALFHETLRPERFPTVQADGGYIFAGGNSDRDYSSLVEAMSKVDALCLIACSPQTLSGLKLPVNVCRVDANPSQFRQLMASASIVALPMRVGMLRSAGQQTFLNAMKLGKPVIVTDADGAADYIVNGETGVLCTPDALESAISRLIADHESGRAMGSRARVAADTFTVHRTYDRICAIADELQNTLHRPSYA